MAAALVAGALATQASLARSPLSAAQRHALDENGLPIVAWLFVVIAIYLSAIIVGVTMSATIGRQARDIALVRAVGAGPGQVRRAIAAQAAVVAVPATLVGVPLGTLGGRAWLDALVSHGVAPTAVGFHSHPAALPIALTVTLGTSMLGALIAAIRPSRVRPAVALGDTAAPKPRIGPIRTALGLVFVLGGCGLSVLISHASAEDADDAAFFVLLAMCLGTGLLAPALLRFAAPLALLFGRTGALAATNLAARATSYSGALVPLVLAGAFATVKVAVHTTVAHAGRPDTDRWLDYSGTSVYTAFAAVAALTTLVTVVLARRRELAISRLVGATRARALGVVICEALVVTVTGLGAAAAAAAATLLPTLHTAVGTWVPYLPGWVLADGVLGMAAVVGLGMVVPAAFLLRGAPIDALGAET
jgi:putative ABC transport system permease protein